MPIPSSKWSLHKFYWKDPQIRPFLPPTSLLNPNSLQSFLSKYQSVYVKPNRKHMGKGIMKVWKSGSGYAFIKERGGKSESSSLEELYQNMMKNRLSQPYIVQKTIHLAKVNHRPFDIRVMMMRNRSKKWQYAGMLAKVAGPDSIITNVARGGGYVTTVGDALRQSGLFKDHEIGKIKRQLTRLSYRVCRRFNRYKFTSQIGIDYGIDTEGRIYIIEVNFDFPSHGLFKKLKDKTYYKRIRRLAYEFRRRKTTRP